MLGAAEGEIEDAESNKRYLEVCVQVVECAHEDTCGQGRAQGTFETGCLSVSACVAYAVEHARHSRLCCVVLQMRS